VPGLGDDEVAAAPNDPPRLLEDDVEPVTSARDAALGLRDDLVGDDEDVARLEVGGLAQEDGQVVALTDLGQAGDRDDAELGQGRPVTRSPVCVR
jgi:hypothetical protein